MKKILAYGVLIALAIVPACDDGGGSTPRKIQDDPVIQARLESLLAEPGQLNPVFSPDTLSYEVAADESLAEITVTAVPAEECTALINGQALVPDDYSAVVALTGDVTVVTVSVSADGADSREYRISVVKMRQSQVTNWSFELFDTVDGVYVPQNWTVSSTGGDFIVSTTCAKDGSHAAYFSDLTGTIAGREVLSDAVGVDPDEDMTIGAWIYAPGGRPADAAGAGFKVYYFTDGQCLIPCKDALGKNITYTKNKVSPEDVDTWEQVSFVRTAADIPDDAAYIRIGLRACYNATNGGTKDDVIYFDSITVEQ